ncbi:hypothetical protein ADIARSV_1206 [Arcticibacter svalbardensis MN12-7]|uniref:Uncharacterized protein n=1 Tax=Arcticibacter svalbardensis MN12-7 TaxID=1150600 RepID=R9GVQ8_9SPHI|nr:hypothetical protein ADIARSV_1206 [Arcticibacter svalbardensis MN12-7]
MDALKDNGAFVFVNVTKFKRKYCYKIYFLGLHTGLYFCIAMEKPGTTAEQN